MNRIVLLAASLLFAQLSFGQVKWNLDNSHSSVKFTVDHLVISEVEGNFKKFTGNVESNGTDFNGAKVNFQVETGSVNTDNEMRDGHLKSDDFFNAEKFPLMTFKSVSFKKKGGNKYELIGDLTIRDVTKRVTFAVVYGGTVKDPYGNVKAGFKATSSIDRYAYGLKWSATTEAGGAVVGQNVDIVLNLEFAQAK